MSSPISNSTSPTKAFSPVNVIDSPIATQKGQLRGIPRTVRDAAAELFNTVQEWNRLHIQGMNIIQGIIAKKLEQLNKIHTKSGVYPEGLQDDCNQLEEVCCQQDSCVHKMAQLLKNFKAIEQLEEMNKTSARPIFITWTVEKYVTTAKALYEAYNSEVKVKFYIKENIGHVDSEDNLMVLCSLWAHQPYVDSGLDFYLESMLKETGLR